MKITRKTGAYVAATLILLGCPSGDGDGGETGSGSASAEASSSADASSGSRGETGGDCIFSSNLCGSEPVLCSVAFGPPGCGPQQIIVGDPNCVAAALQQGTPGLTLLTLTVTEPGAEGAPCGYNDLIYIMGDGTAILYRSGLDGPIISGDRVEVRSPEFFDDCVESDDFATLQACLTDWFVPDSCVPGACCPAESPNPDGHPLCE